MTAESLLKHALSPSDLSEVSLRECRKCIKIGGRETAVPHTFEKKVVQAERQIERRITIPRAFGVEEDWASWSDEDVFRRYVAVNQALLCCESSRRELHQPIGNPGVAASCCLEVRLEPDWVEDVVRCEQLCEVLVSSGRLVDTSNRSANAASESDVHQSVPELPFPDGMVLWIEIRHRE